MRWKRFLKIYREDRRGKKDICEKYERESKEDKN